MLGGDRPCGRLQRPDHRRHRRTKSFVARDSRAQTLEARARSARSRSARSSIAPVRPPAPPPAGLGDRRPGPSSGALRRRSISPAMRRSCSAASSRALTAARSPRSPPRARPRARRRAGGPIQGGAGGLLSLGGPLGRAHQLLAPVALGRAPAPPPPPAPGAPRARTLTTHDRCASPPRPGMSDGSSSIASTTHVSASSARASATAASGPWACSDQRLGAGDRTAPRLEEVRSCPPRRATSALPPSVRPGPEARSQRRDRAPLRRGGARRAPPPGRARSRDRPRARRRVPRLLRRGHLAGAGTG